MIDFLKISVIDPEIIDFIRNNKNLQYHSTKERVLNDKETIFSKETLQYNEILFEFSQKQLVILFKPHYYFNKNLHNANDFKVDSCVSIIKEFIQIFKLSKLDEFRIVNIEYGVNFNFPKYGKKLISMLAFASKNEFFRDSLLLYSKKAGSHNKKGVCNGFKILKFYCKGIQYPQYAQEDTLRFEVKSKKSSRIKKMGIHHLGDLLSPKVYLNMKNDLTTELEKILILDSETNLTNLTVRDQKKLLSYLLNHKWFNAIQKSRNNFSDMKKRYFQLLDKSGYNVHKDLIKIVSKKLDEIFNDYEKSANFPSLEKDRKSANCLTYKGEVCTRMYP